MKDFFRKTEILIALALLSVSASASASTIFQGNFNDQYNNTYKANQVTTGLKLEAYTGIIGWTSTGLHVNHLVDRSGNGDWAVMLFDGSNPSNNNTIQSSIIPDGNIANHAYRVSFEIAPTVFTDSTQATDATDGVVLEVVDGNGLIVKTKTFLSGSFGPNVPSFSTVDLDYTGTGAGGNKMSLFFTANNPGASRFGGAIDNVTVEAVPEPETYAMLLAGLGVLGFVARRRKSL